MTREPVAIQQQAELSDAAALMDEYDIRHLPVLDDDKALVGVVSERDIALVETLLPAEWETIAVAEAMTTAPYSVAPETPIAEVARVMAAKKLGSAVVTDGDGAVQGIFTTVDALRALARACGLDVD